MRHYARTTVLDVGNGWFRRGEPNSIGDVLEREKSGQLAQRSSYTLVSTWANHSDSEAEGSIPGTERELPSLVNNCTF
jgi:hypothetical protein